MLTASDRPSGEYATAFEPSTGSGFALPHVRTTRTVCVATSIAWSDAPTGKIVTTISVRPSGEKLIAPRRDAGTHLRHGARSASTSRGR